MPMAIFRSDARSAPMNLKNKSLSHSVLSQPMQISTESGTIKLAVYFGNQHATTAMSSLTLDFAIDGCTVAQKPTELDVGAGQQIPMFTLVTCSRPFSAPVHATANFDFLGRQSVRFELPISIALLMAPAVMQSVQQFESAWSRFANEREFSVSLPLERVESIVEQLMHMSITEDGDMSLASAVMHTAAKNSQGNPVTMPCMFKFVCLLFHNPFSLSL